MNNKSLKSLFHGTMVPALCSGLVTSIPLVYKTGNNLLATGDYFRVLPDFIELPSRAIQQFFYPDYLGVSCYLVFSIVFFLPVFLGFHLIYKYVLKRIFRVYTDLDETLLYGLSIITFLIYVGVNLIVRQNLLRGQFLSWKSLVIQVLLLGFCYLVIKLGLYARKIEPIFMVLVSLRVFNTLFLNKIYILLVIFYLVIPYAFSSPIAINEKEINSSRGVIFISIDTLRADHLGVYGYPEPTSPIMDFLTRKGVMFKENISQAPWTIPSHMSMFTSLYPSVHGCENITNMLPKGIPTMTEILKKQGFNNMGVVSHITVNGKYGFDRGFNVYHDTESLLYHPAPLVTRAALTCLKKIYGGKFFLFIHYFEPHLPYLPPPPYTDIFFPGKPFPLLKRTKGFSKYDQPYPSISKKELIQLKAQYDGEIRYTDKALEPLLEFLTNKNLWNKVLLVITSDHGEEFLEHGTLGHQSNVFHTQVHVPLIMVGPGKFLPRGIQHHLVQNLDIMPTILDFLGIKPNTPMQGKSLASSKPAHSSTPVAFSELKFSGIVSRSLQMEKYKIIVNDNVNQGKNYHHTFTSLFNLDTDPGESVPLLDTTSKKLELLYESKIGELLKNSFELKKQLVGKEIQKNINWNNDTREKLKTLGYLQ